MGDLVLVVEDEKDWRDRHRLILEKAGFICVFASGYVEAIGKLKLAPLAMILDLGLDNEEYRNEDWKGWDLARQAKSQGISLIIVTGHTKDRITSRAFREFNVVDLFNKADFLKNKSTYIQRVSEAIDKTKKRQKSKKKNRITRTDFLIVTALEEEKEAILNKLKDLVDYIKLPPVRGETNIYYSGNLPVEFSDGVNASYHIILLPLIGKGRLKAATATGKALIRWKPDYVVLAGIAGGIGNKGVKLGDILVSDQIVDYEMQKETSEGPEVRWEVFRSHSGLVAAALNLTNWEKSIATKRPQKGIPKRFAGPIASGDKVIAFKPILDKYRKHWPALIGVEMEAAGVAAAIYQADDPPGFLMIKSVSDLADENKGTSRVEKWRSYACDIAASYVIEYLKNGPIMPKGWKL